MDNTETSHIYSIILLQHIYSIIATHLQLYYSTSTAEITKTRGMECWVELNVIRYKKLNINMNVQLCCYGWICPQHYYSTIQHHYNYNIFQHISACAFQHISAHFSLSSHPIPSSLTKLGLGLGFPKGNPNQKRLI